MNQKNFLMKSFNFSDTVIPASLIFIFRTNVVAFIHPNPISENHVIICSKRCVKRLSDLNESETLDLWMTAHEVSKFLETSIYNKNAQVFFQDGVYDGTFPEHVNVQIIPIEQKFVRERPNFKLESLEEIANKYRNAFEQCFK